MDNFEEIIDMNKRRGFLKHDEKKEAFPSEFSSQNGVEDLMDLLQDRGVKVIDNHVID